MSQNNICLQCGEELKYKDEEYGVSLAHLKNIKLDLKEIPEEKRTGYLISVLAQRTEGTIDVITEYVNHKMKRCTPKKRDCPKCGVTLKTWRAKLCLECGEEFESLFLQK